MGVRQGCGRGLLVLGLVAGACSSDAIDDVLPCGPGTEARDGQCVVAEDGGAADCNGDDCGGSSASAGKSPQMGGTAAGGRSSLPSAGMSMTDGGLSEAGGGGTSGGVTETNGGEGGAVHVTSSGGEGGMSVEGGAAGVGGGGDGSASNDEVVKVSGCGKPFIGQSGVKVTIQTSGVKAQSCADVDADGKPVCGAWSTPRDYYVFLPAGYDFNHAYPLVFEGPGCGGNGLEVEPLQSNVDNTVIRVGLTPGPISLGHATNPNQGCFDDHEGDDSIDFVFYEQLYDKLSGELCFDKNRVFANNVSSSFLANELGCKYAGDPKRPIRGVLANTGGLPTEPQWTPTCTKHPMAGMWVHELYDEATPFSFAKTAISRAMVVNGCTWKTYDDAVTHQALVDYPIGGGNPDDTCKKLTGCSAQYPLVVCALPGIQHSAHSSVTNPGFATFLSELMLQ